MTRGGATDSQHYDSMLRMGVTTAIGGNCGINTVSPLRYLELMDRDGGPINMGLLAGHTFLREQAGHRDKYSAIRPDEQQRLSRLVKEALEAGCFGVSFGIRYVPGVTRDEMVKPPASAKAMAVLWPPMCEMTRIMYSARWRSWFP